MKTLKSILLLHLLLAVSVLCAQEVQSFKQHNMKRWGIPAGNYSGIAPIGGDRYALISEINNAAYQPLRQFLYDYHRQGLDVMSEKQEQGREAILGAIVQLRNVYERNSMSYFLQLIVESKRDEIIQIFSQGDMKVRTEVSNIMKAIDPSQSSRYDEMLQNKGF